MGAGWFYMTTGWFRKTRKVGPISEADLLKHIEQGKIEPETMLSSCKTKDKWVPMSSIRPAMKRWKKLHPELEPENAPTQTKNAS